MDMGEETQRDAKFYFKNFEFLLYLEMAVNAVKSKFPSILSFCCSYHLGTSRWLPVIGVNMQS